MNHATWTVVGHGGGISGGIFSGRGGGAARRLMWLALRRVWNEKCGMLGLEVGGCRSAGGMSYYVCFCSLLLLPCVSFHMIRKIGIVNPTYFFAQAA